MLAAQGLFTKLCKHGWHHTGSTTSLTAPMFKAGQVVGETPPTNSVTQGNRQQVGITGPHLAKRPHWLVCFPVGPLLHLPAQQTRRAPRGLAAPHRPPGAAQCSWWCSGLSLKPPCRASQPVDNSLACASWLSHSQHACRADCTVKTAFNTMHSGVATFQFAMGLPVQQMPADMHHAWLSVGMPNSQEQWGQGVRGIPGVHIATCSTGRVESTFLIPGSN